MIEKNTQGILYPQEASINISFSNKTVLPAVFTVPRMSWDYVHDKIKSVFEEIGPCNPSNIFVFSYLRNGKIGFDDDFTIYTDSDCQVSHPLLTKNSDVCSEEFGAEILLPYLDKYFNGIPVNQFLTPEKNAENKEFFRYVVKNYRNALIFISRNESEDPVWPESLQD